MGKYGSGGLTVMAARATVGYDPATLFVLGFVSGMAAMCILLFLAVILL